ncbi:MAG: hypothetical protein HC836_07100 [Richelia sp. RM2_1_2]|nr:hypothetical protein [Richelia sp. RM1_1_1]NJO26181.1 hypothetical protein [Richelia sp. SL_2_1]NJO58122.1 hypothetical protein [Richelia sp. RM2_1_2]
MTDSNKTRVLLALWALGGTKQEVKRTEVTDKVKRKKQSAKDYQKYLKELETVGAIAITTQKRLELVFLTDKGVEMLGEGLKNPDFEFEGTIVGTWAANALLRWIGEVESSVNSAPAPQTQNGKSLNNAIASYKEFEQFALEVYDNLNRDYNFNNLVPIYRIRREIGDRVSRKQFSEWLLEMQAEDIFQLEGGSVEDSAADKIEDSITTELDGLRCYASKLQN